MGELKKSIRTSSNARKRGAEASVKAGNKKAYYYGFVEYVTAPHIIKSGKRKSRLVFMGLNGHLVNVKQVNHKGAKAKPYMRPALDSKGDEAVFAVAKRIRERLTKEGINVVAPEGQD
jgi:hypothetical protein